MSPFPPALLTLVAAGCAEVPCAEGYEARGEDVCVATVPDATPAAGTVWSAEQGMARLDAALAYGIPDPTVIAAAYTGAVLQGDAACPALNDNGAPGSGEGVWVADCTATSGWSYAGSSLFDDARGDARSLWLAASFTMIDPQGNAFRGGGEVRYDLVTAGEVSTWTGQVGGVFGWAGEAGWLGSARGEALFLEGRIDASGRTLRLDGGIEYESATIRFSGLEFDTAACDAPVRGSVAVREPDGTWLTLELSGDCTGCGELRGDAGALGAACVSLPGVLDALPAELQ